MYTSDHLAMADWSEEKGWKAPEVSPYDYFKIDPINSTLHYAVECYEGFQFPFSYYFQRNESL